MNTKTDSHENVTLVRNQTRRETTRMDVLGDRTPEGYLRARAYLGRTGIQIYRKADGTTVRELRLPEEVFSDATMESALHKVLTDNHPPFMLDATNTKDFQRGNITGNIGRKEGGDVEYLTSDLQVTDQDVIDKIDAGQDQLSLGYLCDIENTPGTHPVWGAYDAIQRNIRINHVARVDRGRAGDQVKVRFDAEEEPMATAERTDMSDQEKLMDMCGKYKDGEMFEFTDSAGNKSMYRVQDGKPVKFQKNQNKGDQAMQSQTTTLRLDGVDFTVSEQAAYAFNTAIQRKDSQIDELSKERDQLKKDASAIEAKKDQAEEKAKTAQEKLDAANKQLAAFQLAEVVKQAEPYLPKESKIDGLDANGVKKLALVSNYPALKDSPKLDDAAYVDARFDGLLESEAKQNDSPAFDALKQQGAAGGGVKRVDESDIDAAIQDMINDFTNPEGENS